MIDDEPAVRAAQLELLLGNVGGSVIPGIVVVAILTWTLADGSNTLALILWSSGAMLPRIVLAWYGRRLLARGISGEEAPGLIGKLFVFNLVHGIAWAALAWITLDTASVTGSVLVASVLVVMASSSVSMFSPVLPVCLAFSLSILVVLASKLWLMDGPSYHALGMTIVLYSSLLYMQARNSSAAARAAINLRFDNIELIERLRAETQKAEEANLAKSKFLAAASHDLRQPLHAVNLFIEALRHERDPAQARDVVEHLGASAQSLEDLLNELLDISKLEAGLFEPRLEVFALQELFETLERELRPLAEEKGIELGFVATRLNVRSDQRMLMRILRNIVTNAIRYTERGAVLVGCRRHGDRAAIAVYDTGPGIAPEHHGAIFREFYQLGNPERDRRKGLGLGLAIVDGLCRLLAHPLRLRSIVGRGSAFFVHVPIAMADAPRQAMPDAPSSTLQGRAILVIDDEPAIGLAMKAVLERWGCLALAAESASDALAKLTAHAFEPDAIVADYRLHEGRTGAEAIDDIRRKLGRDIPAAILTGDTAPERLREATASGYLLLHKPLQPARLHAALADQLLAHL